MEIKNNNSEEISSLFCSLEESFELIKSTLENRTLTLNGERFLTNRDICDILHISQRTLQDWRDTGKIPYIQISGKVLYKESDVKRLLEKNYFGK